MSVCWLRDQRHQPRHSRGQKVCRIRLNTTPAATSGNNLVLDVRSDSKQTLNEGLKASRVFRFAVSLCPWRGAALPSGGRTTGPSASKSAVYIAYQNGKRPCEPDGDVPDSGLSPREAVKARFKKVSFQYAWLRATGCTGPCAGGRTPWFSQDGNGNRDPAWFAIPL